jgi:predicted Fe-Mo cluster-binding NifX family protein
MLRGKLGRLSLVCFFVANAFGHTDTFSVSNSGNNTIMKFDSIRNGSVLASGLNLPTLIAGQVPQPATWALPGLGVAVVFGNRRLRRRSS